MATETEPLLGHSGTVEEEEVKKKIASSSTFSTAQTDIEPITGLSSFFTHFRFESKKLWYLAGPAIFASLCRYSLGAVTQLAAGQLGTLSLAAVSVENSVIAGFSFGVMLGMGSALETLCGQAYGAGQVDMLGIYMQRSWVILNSTALVLCFVYIFAGACLKAIGQAEQIAEAAGTFALYMIPQLFAYSMNFPISKFLQAQSKIMVMAIIAFAALLLHCFFTWLLMIRLGWGLVGGAVALNSSWWFIVVAQLVYIFCGSSGGAWSGFSWKAFQNLWGFYGLSLVSGLMLCLEVWYYYVLILFAGYLKNAEISVDALSICMNILGWANMVAFGANAATSVRVSNELGAGHPRTAKFSVVVAVIFSFTLGLLLSITLLLTRHSYPKVFTNSEEVRRLVNRLTPLLAISITVNNVQPVLTGVAIGAGWQATIAYVNLACYYLFGVPLGLFLGYKMDMGVEGIWCGMLGGTLLQTFILFLMTYKTNWNSEASIAGKRVKTWRAGGKRNRDHEEVMRP